MKTNTEDTLRTNYKKIVDAIKDEGGQIYSDKLAEKVGLRKGQIGKALQWGRRHFDDKDDVKITDYVMASSSGYFLPTCKEECVAYVAQNDKRIQSEIRTHRLIRNYVNEHWHDDLEKVLNEDSAEDTTYLNDTMIPWDVFDKVINNYQTFTPLKEN
jgi:hypothetical protein